MTQILDIDLLKKQAVEAAINQDWNKAIEFNQALLDRFPHDVASLNRLGFALMRLGQIQEAKETYQQVLTIDKYNPIANKTIQLLSSVKTKGKLTQTSPTPVKITTNFIEQPGKTKTVILVRPASPETLLRIAAGMQVQFEVKKRRVSIETFTGDYPGGLPDDISTRLYKLMNKGFEYKVYIKSCQNKHLSVFIMESKRPQADNDIVSFPSTTSSNEDLFFSRPQVEEEPFEVTEEEES